MRVLINDSGIERVVHIQEFVHYANVTSESGGSKNLAMSQAGVREAINQTILESELVKIFEYQELDEGSEDPVEKTEYQKYVDYLLSVQESESNRLPGIPLSPTYKEYLDFIEFDYSSIGDIFIQNPVDGGILTNQALNYTIIITDNILIPAGLPIGFNCSFIGRINLLELSLISETFINSGVSTEVLDSNKLYEVTKISEDGWIIK